MHACRTIHPDNVKMVFESETRLLPLWEILENQSTLERLRQPR